MSKNPYPETVTAESAYYALNGPAEQVRQDLRRIIRQAEDWGTTESLALAGEAKAYLAERE
jgi:hypothetical protein